MSRVVRGSYGLWVATDVMLRYSEASAFHSKGLGFRGRIFRGVPIRMTEGERCARTRAIRVKLFHPARARAFSLVEVLVVIGIIAILLALLMPTLSRVRESARTVQCAAQLRQLGQAFHNYAAANAGHLPSWSGWHIAGGDGTGEDDPGPAWSEMLAPWFVPATSPIYNCPSFPEGYPFNYFISSRWLRMNGRHSLLMSEIKCSSEFVLSGDTTHEHLYPPSLGNAPETTNDCDKDDAVGPALVFFGEAGGFNLHRAGNNVLFADGHVAPFFKFDPRYMTFHPQVLAQNWGNIDGPSPE